MKNLGMTDKITCPAFGLYSSPTEYTTMGHTVLDLTSLAFQPRPSRVSDLVTQGDM